MSRLKKYLQNAGFFFLMRERERWVIKRTIDFWALQLHSMTPFKKSSRVGARKIHFFLLCTIILYHFDILGLISAKKLIASCVQLTQSNGKNKFEIERYFGWKGLVHSDLGFPHVGHILQMGQFGLLQSGSPCKITLTRLIICLKISAGVIFMWFNALFNFWT